MIERKMIRTVVATLGLLAAPTAADAQVAQPKFLVHAWAGGFTAIGDVQDASSRWRFGESLAYGGGASYRITPQIAVAADAIFSRPEFAHDDERPSEDADILGGILSGRLQTGGISVAGIYLTGGGGFLRYNVPAGETAPSASSTDLALYAGTGLEYTPGRYQVFLEWGRFWAYHESEDIGSERSNHSLVRLGARYAFSR